LRARKNKKQTECESRAERIHNMKEVFAIKPKAHVSARAAYVLIDDVITTGATMRAAQQTLTEGGARTVLGISIAYQELL
jgi:predicted amidophosphoribosyltransferase